MQHHYSIARQETGENYIRIDIDTDDDGSLTMSDYCRGPAAEQCFGCDDIESVVTLSPESVLALYEGLTGFETEDPATDLALLVQANKHDDTSAQTWLRSECNELGIRFEWHH
jgi:hypothetical protein